MLSSVYGLVNKNLLVFEARQKLGSLIISRNKVNGGQVKELNEDREDEPNHNDVEQLLQKSELPMPSKDENFHIRKDWRRSWLVFLLASLLVFSVVTGITILNYLWLVSKIDEGSTEKIHENINCNSNEGIFIEEGSPIADTKKLPDDTCSCDRGTMWTYNFTKQKHIIDNELFVVHGQPKICKNFCMCDNGNGCYRPKNNSNYRVLFLQHCEKSCQFLTTFWDEPYEPFLDDYGREIRTSGKDYVKVDSIGCNGCVSLKRSHTCSKQSTLDNLQIKANETTAEITWSVTSNFSIVDLQVYKVSAPKHILIMEEEDRTSPTFVNNLTMNEKYILSVYFYPDRRTHVNPQKWSIAFNRNFRTMKID